MKYAHRSFLVDVAKATKNEYIDTQYGLLTIRKGDIILTDLYGAKSAVPEKVFNKHYVPVEEVVVKGDLASSYEAAYKEFSLESQVEEQQYITDFQRKVRERNAQTETN